MQKEEILKGTKSGMVHKLTDKAILFEFWSPKKDSMIQKWIPKSVVTKSIAIKETEHTFGYLVQESTENLVEGQTAWLRLKNWAMKEIFDIIIDDNDGIDCDGDEDMLWALADCPNMH